MPPLALFLSALAVAFSANAFTFSITEEPVQCGQLTMNWTGGVPPYEVTLLPLNGINDTTSIWTDSVTDANITSSSTSTVLALPAGANFTIVLSDYTGFGTGGTSQVYTVGSSSDSSCLPTPLHPLQFFFTLTNNNRLTECGQIEFQISGATELPVTLRGIVPGGESWQYVTPKYITGAGWPAGWTTNQMNWTLQVAQGTQIAFMVGDLTGTGSGGTTELLTVGAGNTSSCLSEGYFSTTAAPAAGAINTAPASSSSGSSSSSTSHLGAIIGGVVGGIGGVVVLVAGVMFIMHRYNRRKRERRLQSINLQTYKGHRTRLQDSVDSKSGFIIGE